MTQISTNVQQTMEDVALEPAVLTRWVVSHVLVTVDILEMDLLVLVSRSKHVFNDYISCSLHGLYSS